MVCDESLTGRTGIVQSSFVYLYTSVESLRVVLRMERVLTQAGEDTTTTPGTTANGSTGTAAGSTPHQQQPLEGISEDLQQI